MRLQKVRDFLKEKNLDAFLVTHLPNVRYLTGFTGSAGRALILADQAHFITDFRYQEQSKAEVDPAFQIHIVQELWPKLQELLQSGMRVGFESEFTSYDFYQTFQEKVPGVELVPFKDVILLIRARKEPGEVQLIRKAQEITERVFQHVLQILEPGKVTEVELAAEMEYQMRRLGADGPAFPSIVASGPHSALPHAKPRPVVIPHNTMVILDFGAVYQGYASDMTRTLWIGGVPDPKFEEIYRITLEAQNRAIEAAQPGMEAKALDAVARNFIAEKGYGEQFGHGLGHGVGLEIHERPVVGKLSKDKLEVGHLFTVEPGIYLPGFGGVRIEDMVYLGPEGVQNLTTAPKELIRL